MLNFQNLQLRRGTRVLLENASCTLFRGEKIGVIGANGSGKSSLFALIRGELQPEAGEFSRPADLRMAWVAQEVPALETSALDYVVDGDTELREVERRVQAADAAHDGTQLAVLHARYEALGGYSARARAAQLLDGIGFAPSDLERSVASFSGGWRMRLSLAQALMSPSDLLLLDEPTNHLDLDAIIWLEGWLREYRGTLLVIAHDREFLDRVVSRILHLEARNAQAYAGNYSSFEVQRAANLALQQSMFERQQREIRHAMQFVERFRAKASKARQAQSRLKMLERMPRIAPAHVDAPFEFAFPQPPKLPRPLLTLEEQSAGYAGRQVLANVNLVLSPGDRVAILGRNGAGKSTLMKLLAGSIEASDGRRFEAADLCLGYFAQHQLEQLDDAMSPIEHLARHGGARMAAAPEQELRDHLGTFGFRGDRVFEPLAPFSGGERARLVLATLVAARPNLLLLDEPTNHLDLEMRHALGMALQDYAGALVVVSHDRHLIRSIADDLWMVADGRVGVFDGDLDDYARLLTESRAASTELARSGPSAAEQRRAQKRAEAEQRNRLSPLRAEVRALEQEIARLDLEKAALERTLTDPATYDAAARQTLAETLERQRAIRERLSALEARWLEVSETLQSAERAS
ncbi:MAG TPA: ATP-binding cassette domain-containing protein [Steroidobacteraceae bacterium]|nr:ATP-binding cassette domain-containing protein [Steroidobacteraceae bacterium]